MKFREIGMEKVWLSLHVLIVAAMTALYATTSNSVVFGPPPGGTLNASPSPCIIPAGSDTCMTTLTWTSKNLSPGDQVGIWRGFGPQLAACGTSGTQQVLVDPPVSGFNMTAGPGSCSAYSSLEAANALVSVAAVYAVKPTGSISASPNPCKVAPGGVMCTSTINWNTSNARNVGVWVHMDTNGTTRLFSCATNHSQTASWIVPGHSYYFTMVSGPDAFSNFQEALGEGLLGYSVTVTATK